MPSTDHAVHGIDRLLTRDLPRGMAAHAVCDDVETQVVVDQEGVFVQLSALTDIGQSRTVVLQLILVQQ